MNHYHLQSEIEAVVQGFENCTTAKEAFTHREHLAVAVWYLYHSNAEQTLERMRMGLLRFLDHHQVGAGKYKEGLTVSWIKLIDATINELGPGLDLVELTNSVLDRLSNSALIGGGKPNIDG